MAWQGRCIPVDGGGGCSVWREGRSRELLLRFLRGRGCEAAAEGETDVAVDDCDRPPDLATLVALVEEWRSAARVPETVLELGERRTILRAEA